MNFFKTLIGSFYSPAVYVQARTPQPGMNMLYSFLLVIITVAAFIIIGSIKLDRFLLQAPEGQLPLLDRTVKDFAAQIPVMVLHKGVLQVKAPQPHTIYVNTEHGKENAFALVTIDTTGATTVHNMQTPVLVTSKEVYFHGNHDTKVYPLKQSDDDTKPLIINQALVSDTAERIVQWIHQNAWKIHLIFSASFGIMLIIAVYLLRVIMLMVLGLAGIALSYAFKPSINFSTAVRIAAVAYTPVAIFSAIAMALTGRMPNWQALLTLGVLMTAAALHVSSEE